MRLEKLYASVVVLLAPNQFQANDHLPRVSRQSANDKSDNEVKPGAANRYPGIYLAA